MPEKFHDPATTLVVFDLGHLQFNNTAAGLTEDRASQRDDETEGMK